MQPSTVDDVFSLLHRKCVPKLERIENRKFMFGTAYINLLLPRCHYHTAYMYRSRPILKNHLVSPTSRPLPFSQETRKKYNPPVSDAHVLKTLPAIIHARRMLLPRYGLGVHVWRYVSQVSASFFLRVNGCVQAARVTDSCPRIQECMRKYDITHGKVSGHLCRVNY